MCELRELDISSRGVVDVVEKWKRDHDRVRQVWSVENLIAEVCETCRLASTVVAHHEEKHTPPGDAQFSYVLELIQHVSRVAHDTEALGAAAAAHYAVENLDNLRQYCQQLVEIIARHKSPPPFTADQLAMIEMDVPKEWLEDCGWDDYADR